VEVEHAHKDGFGDSVGLMGTFHGGHLVARDGSTIIEDPVALGMQWQVRDTEPMLFQEAVEPQYPQICRMPAPEAIQPRQLSEMKVTLVQAMKACLHWSVESRESCIYDVMSTNDLAMAQSG